MRHRSYRLGTAFAAERVRQAESLGLLALPRPVSTRPVSHDARANAFRFFFRHRLIHQPHPMRGTLDRPVTQNRLQPLIAVPPRPNTVPTPILRAPGPFHYAWIAPGSLSADPPSIDRGSTVHPRWIRPARNRRPPAKQLRNTLQRNGLRHSNRCPINPLGSTLAGQQYRPYNANLLSQKPLRQASQSFTDGSIRMSRRSAADLPRRNRLQ